MSLREIIDELRRLHGHLDIHIDERRKTVGFARSFKCPLDFYERRGSITPSQHSAGLALASLHFHAFGKAASVASKYQPRTEGNKRTNWFAAPMIDYLHAYQAIRGRTEREVGVRVCCYDQPAGKRGEMVYLRSALDDLERYFRR